MRALEAREDLLNAMKVKRAGGQFVTPKSLEALAEFDVESAEFDVESAEAAEPAPQPAAQYCRAAHLPSRRARLPAAGIPASLTVRIVNAPRSLLRRSPARVRESLTSTRSRP